MYVKGVFADDDAECAVVVVLFDVVVVCVSRFFFVVLAENEADDAKFVCGARNGIVVNIDMRVAVKRWRLIADISVAAEMLGKTPPERNVDGNDGNKPMWRRSMDSCKKRNIFSFFSS